MKHSEGPYRVVLKQGTITDDRYACVEITTARGDYFWRPPEGFNLGQQRADAQRIVDCLTGMALIDDPFELVRMAKMALAALETPGDLTSDELGYVIKDLDHVLRGVLDEESKDG